MTFDIGLHEVCVRTGVRYVITKFSGMDSLPNFLTHGAPLRARFARAAAPLIRDFPEDGVFFKKVFYRNLALLHLHILLLPFIVLLQNKHTTLAENAENLISAHLELAPTLKVRPKI